MDSAIHLSNNRHLACPWLNCSYLSSVKCTYLHSLGLSPNSSNVLNASQVYRSLPIALSTENEIYCENTEQTQTTWTVSKFDDDPRVLKAVPVSSLRKTVHRSDISTQDLLLPGKELPYGLYEISARVEMRGLAEVFGTGSLYVQVLQTPWIEAAVVGGSFHTVAFGFSVCSWILA